GISEILCKVLNIVKKYSLGRGTVHLSHCGHTKYYICQHQNSQTDFQSHLHLVRKHMDHVQQQRVCEPNTQNSRSTEKQQVDKVQISLKLKSGLAVVPPLSVEYFFQNDSCHNNQQEGDYRAA